MSTDEKKFEGGHEQSDYMWKQCIELHRQLRYLRSWLEQCKMSGDTAGHQPAIGELTASVRALHAQVQKFYASEADASFIMALNIMHGSYALETKQTEETIKAALELTAL